MKPLSERDENIKRKAVLLGLLREVGMKPLSERDENLIPFKIIKNLLRNCRNEATL